MAAENMGISKETPLEVTICRLFDASMQWLVVDIRFGRIHLYTERVCVLFWLIVVVIPSADFMSPIKAFDHEVATPHIHE
jgi:hypothetical protein